MYSSNQIAGIRALHDEMMARYAVRDRLSYFKLNQSIHSAIVRAADNAMLLETHEMLQARIKRIRFVGNDTPDRWAAAVSEHEEMIAALVKRQRRCARRSARAAPRQDGRARSRRHLINQNNLYAACLRVRALAIEWRLFSRGEAAISDGQAGRDKARGGHGRVIIDAHHHVLDPIANNHPWLREEPMIPFRYGDYSAIRRRYLPADYRVMVGSCA